MKNLAQDASFHSPEKSHHQKTGSNRVWRRGQAEGDAFVQDTGSKINNASSVISDCAQRAIESGPSFGVDLALKTRSNVLLAAGPEFERDLLGGAPTQTAPPLSW